MKKVLLGVMMAAAVLSGCREGRMDADSGFETQTEETMESVTQTEETTEPETQGSVRAEFSRDSVFIALELPDDWDYEIVEKDETESCGIVFGPKEHEELRYRLYYHTMYGICATGVTIEELQLENGTNISRFSEIIEGMLWRDIVFECDNVPDKMGTYVLNYSGDEKLVMEYEDILQDILETVVVGN